MILKDSRDARNEFENTILFVFLFSISYQDIAAAAAAKSLQSCPTLCNPMNCSPPGSSVHGILQARTMEWAAISYSGDLPHPGIEPVSPALAGRFFITGSMLGQRLLRGV